MISTESGTNTENNAEFLTRSWSDLTIYDRSLGHKLDFIRGRFALYSHLKFQRIFSQDQIMLPL